MRKPDAAPTVHHPPQTRPQDLGEFVLIEAVKPGVLETELVLVGGAAITKALTDQIDRQGGGI